MLDYIEVTKVVQRGFMLLKRRVRREGRIERGKTGDREAEVGCSGVQGCAKGCRLSRGGERCGKVRGLEWGTVIKGGKEGRGLGEDKVLKLCERKEKRCRLC